MNCKKCNNLVDEDVKFCGSCGEQIKNIEEQKNNDYDFLYIPISRLVWASLLSFGIYTIYWFVNNWEAIQKVTGEKIKPLWRAIFSIFYSYRPFTLALKQAKDLGYEDGYNVNFMNGFYFVAVIINRVVSKIPDTSATFDLLWIIGGTLLVIYPLIQVQTVINWSSNKKGKVYKKIGAPELVLIALAWVIVILSAFSNS
jgi:hypothetical protein